MFQTYDHDASAPTTEIVFCITCGHTDCNSTKILFNTAVRAESGNTFPVGVHE